MIRVNFTADDKRLHGRIDGYVVKDGETIAVIYGDDGRFYEVPVRKITPQ